MYSSKLFDCVKTINPKEWKRIRLSIGRQCGEASDVYRLYTYIEQHKQNLEHPRLSISTVSNVLFTNKSKKFVLNVMSSLKQEIIHALTHLQLDDSPDLFRMIKFDVLNKRGLYREANKVAAQLQTESEQHDILNLWKWFYTLRVNHLQFFSNNTIKQNIIYGKEMASNLIQSYKRFNSAVLKYTAVEIQMRQIIYAEDWTDELSEIKHFFITDDHLLDKVIDLQYEFAESKFQKEPQKLLNILFDDSLEISSYMLLSIYYRIRRFYIDQIRRGESRYNDQLAELIIWSMGQHAFIEDHRINENQFTSDVIVLAKLGRPKKALEYININSPYLEKSIRNEIVVMSKMQVFFAEGDFLEVVKIYSTILFKGPTIKVTATSVFIKASYEFNEEKDIILRYIRNASEALKRNKKKIAVTFFQSHKHFLIAMQYLLSDKRKLKEFLETDLIISDRIWLHEKLGSSN